MENEIKFYPLTPAQVGTLSIEQLCGRIYNNLCIMVNFEQDDIDPKKMEEAINLSIERDPSKTMRLRNFKEGKEKVIKQYFVEKPESKCVTVSFDSDKKMYKFINKQHMKPFPNDFQDCDLYRVALIKRANGRYSLLVCMYHLTCDAYSIIKFVEDVVKVYISLTQNTEMPAPFAPLMPVYEELWAYTDSSKHEKDITFWNEYWKKLKQVPQYSTLNGFHDKSGAYIPGQKYGNMAYVLNNKATHVNCKVPKELLEKMQAFCMQHGFSDKMLYVLAFKSWFAKQSDRNASFILNDIVANRGKKSFANTVGNTSTGIVMALDAPNDMNIVDACKYTLNNQLSTYKHCMTINMERDAGLYGLMGLDKVPPVEKFWLKGTSSVLFTYQPYIPLGQYNMKVSIERFSSGSSPFPLYMTVMPTDTYSGDMNLNYEYMTKIYKEEDILKYHKYLLKFMETAIANPEITLNELIDLDVE